MKIIYFPPNKYAIRRNIPLQGYKYLNLKTNQWMPTNHPKFKDCLSDKEQLNKKIKLYGGLKWTK